MSRYAWVVLPLVLAAGCTHLQMGMFLLRDNPSAGDPVAVERGKISYQKNCATCHGERADGRGADRFRLGTPPTDFTQSGYEKAPGRIAARIAYGKGADMPAFGSTLPDDVIWDIANYLHSLQPTAAVRP